MFNAMTPAELTALLAELLNDSASWERPLDGFQTGQLKSAGSIGRHLTAELRGAPPVAAAFADDVARVLDEERTAEPAEARTAVERALVDDPTPVGLGAALADLLAAGRRHPEAERLCVRIRELLRDLADAEIDILSAPPSATTGGAA